jgi:hypothetical protein
VDLAPDYWGYHALLWKHYDEQVPYNASWANPPIGLVMEGDEWILNREEADPCVFEDGDPAGVWSALTGWNFKHLAVAAAFYMQWWSSPVYTNLYVMGQSGYPILTPAAIRRVKFTIDNPYPGGDDFSGLCDWLGWNDPVTRTSHRRQMARTGGSRPARPGKRVDRATVLSC